ncbi:hypothetical protein CCACVL1_10910 [Corchorus capsularis]|uniref:Uncharacterized protein n=1 Tax=Corchorus capsularis TaxID=210143 RepID=A0A1R3INV5_COCAP|nr:hypothetical protein CCACVL1_10910 [Corchorus capsularis]
MAMAINANPMCYPPTGLDK